MTFSSDLFYGTSGPRDAKVMLVGEAWGAEEAAQKKPFVGSSGHEFNKMLAEAGIDRDQCFATNVVSERPPGNKFEAFLHPILARRDLFHGLHAGPKLLEGYSKLWAQIEAVKPRLVIAAGNTPFWALSDRASVSTKSGYKLPGGISKWRGSQLYCKGTEIPLLPIIHPAAILRAWELRYPTVHDLRARASRFLDGTLSWKAREVEDLPNPTPYEIQVRLEVWLRKAQDGPLELAVDIETYRRRDIVCIGLCDGAVSLCIPLFYFDPLGQSESYFPRGEAEAGTILLLRELLQHPQVRTIGQNFIYDYQFLVRTWNIRPNLSFDTMLAHHLCWPGTPKSLHYLASLYCDHYVYWKDESHDWDGQGGHKALWAYNCKDARATFEIAQELKGLIPKLDLTQQWEWQKEQWELAAQMGLRGINYDHTRRPQIRKELDVHITALEDWLDNAMPSDLQTAGKGVSWHSSPTQQKVIFYEILGLRPELHKKTKRPTLNAESFEPLKKQAPWLTPVWERLEILRSLRLFNSHFLDINFTFDGRLRCNFNVGGTETFRWSSSANGYGEGTNLQNIPKGDTDG